MAAGQSMTIEEVVRKVMVDEHAEVLRESVRLVAQELMESEVTELIGAAHGERHPRGRVTQRNGYRPREWHTRVGVIDLAIPKLRAGSYFPHCPLEPRKRGEQALLSVVQQAYVCGVSTRRVDQLVESLGLRISRSEVSRVCEALDEQVEAFRTRPLEGEYPYPWLDAKVEKVRDGGRVVHKAVVVAHGVHESGRREILGIDVGLAETEAFWSEFWRSLVRRGLAGVQLVISDAHEGLKSAIARVLSCPWQRCAVHFLREMLGHARKDQHGALCALIRPIFQAESLDEARARLGDAVERLRSALPKVARLLAGAEEDLLAFYAFPPAHRAKLRSTNPPERFNREIGRRTDVVGIFPDDRSLIRLVGMLCLEQNDEWPVGPRYLSRAAMEPLLEKRLHRDTTVNDQEVPALQAARAAAHHRRGERQTPTPSPGT